MMSDVTFYQYLLLGAGALISVGAVIIGWFLVQQMGDYRKHKETDAEKHEALEVVIGQQEKDLLNMRLHVSETYAKKESLQSSLARVHELMENGFAEQRQDAKEMRSDIKTLIAKVK